MRTVALCEAKCKPCGSVFAHASLGDFAYGEAVFSADDGHCFVLAVAATEFARHVAAEIPLSDANLWPVLAALADPVGGRQLTHRIVCPTCHASELEYWNGKALGFVPVPQATFLQSQKLSSHELARRVGELLG